jgi:trans-aconitate methyltransferase
MDFSTVSKSLKLLKCPNCQTISNPDDVKSELSTFETKQYACSHQTEQTMHIDDFSKAVTRSFIQAKILSKKLKDENPRILDIGCFDGSLLIELDQLLGKSDLCGFDINPHLAAVFPGKDNFNFFSTSLKDVTGQFDLIILSHSILYITDLSELMLTIDVVLKDEGFLFIQIPDISTNPYYTLMGDQSFIFSEISLTNILGKYGYKTEVLSTDYFPRELLIAAHRDESVDCCSFKKDYLFEQNIETIKYLKGKLENINDQNLAVLGTTVNAAFVDEILGEHIMFFVDENLSPAGESFRGKKVKHPNDLSPNNHTILPFGESGIRIKARFEEIYNGTFSLI